MDPPPTLSPEERRWLHDKFERLQTEEASLASARTSYYAAIGTVLLTALVVAIADLLSQTRVLLAVLTFIALLGVLISVVWAILLHRTNDAKNLWREAAWRLEQDLPPLPGSWTIPITLRSNAQLPVDLFRPFQAHDLRFSQRRDISWMDRANPDVLTEVLPLTFLAIWIGVLVGAWTWIGLVH